MKNKVCAVILAGGVGSRMCADTTKQQLKILGKTVLRRTLEAFEACDEINSIVLVARDGEHDFAKESACGITKLYKTVVGGESRAQSAANGFAAIPTDTDYIAIHDAARCLITPDMISRVIFDARKHGAATAATRVTDTVKIVDDSGFISSTPCRDFVMLASTPQIFSSSIYKEAINGVDLSDAGITDDNMLVERMGVKIITTDVGAENLKITRAGDIAYAEFLLKGRER